MDAFTPPSALAGAELEPTQMGPIPLLLGAGLLVGLARRPLLGGA